MKYLFILLLLVNSVNSFLFGTNWNKFFIKTQEIVEPISNKKVKTINQARVFNQETFFIKHHLKNLGNVDYNQIEYNVNNLDELMNKGSMPISSKGGNFCGFIFKFNIPRIDLILGFSLRNRYNDILRTSKPLPSTETVINKYNEMINNNQTLAANYVIDSWLLNKPVNYTKLKECYYNKEINQDKFLCCCQELTNCIDLMYYEIDLKN